MVLLAKLTAARDTLIAFSPLPLPPVVSNITVCDSLFIERCLLPLHVVRLPLDQKYRLTDRETFLDIIAWDWVDRREWQKDVFDCENHAIAFKSHVDWYFGLNQVGIVLDYKSGHAYNLVVFPDGEVMLLEPQSDGLVYWEDRVVVLYSLEGACVLL